MAKYKEMKKDYNEMIKNLLLLVNVLERYNEEKPSDFIKYISENKSYVLSFIDKDIYDDIIYEELEKLIESIYVSLCAIVEPQRDAIRDIHRKQKNQLNVLSPSIKKEYLESSIKINDHFLRYCRVFLHTDTQYSKAILKFITIDDPMFRLTKVYNDVLTNLHIDLIIYKIYTLIKSYSIQYKLDILTLSKEDI